MRATRPESPRAPARELGELVGCVEGRGEKLDRQPRPGRGESPRGRSTGRGGEACEESVQEQASAIWGRVASRRLAFGGAARRSPKMDPCAAIILVGYPTAPL